MTRIRTGAVPVGPVHHRAGGRPTTSTEETGAMPKKPEPATPSADPPSLDVTTPAKKRTLDVKVSRPATPAMREIGGSEYAVWDESLLHRTMMTAPSYVGPDGAPLETYPASLAGLGLRAFAPKDPVEAMIASQAVALHFAALECSRRAMLPQQPSDVASRLRKDAANLSRAMVDMSEALDRRRGKGPQTIRVERVVVYDGGQAVVAGSVVGGGALPASVPAAPTIAQDMPAMEPVEARSAEGAEESSR